MGNFIEDEIHRICLVELDTGTHVLDQIYDIGNNKNYMFCNNFEFDSCYFFLSEKITLISGYSMLESGSDEASKKRVLERPIGTKNAKQLKTKSKGNSVGVKKSAQRHKWKSKKRTEASWSLVKKKR